MPRPRQIDKEYAQPTPQALRVKEARQSSVDRGGQKLSQADLAALIGCSPATISAIERGVPRDSKKLRAIARALEVNYYWLLDGTKPMEISKASSNASPTPNHLEGIHPLLLGLFNELPAAGSVWPKHDREEWTAILSYALRRVYKDAQDVS